MRLLVITQAVDLDNPYLGFFHRWIEHLAKRSEHVYVVGNGVGRHDLPANVTVFSLGKEHGASRVVKSLRLVRYLFRLLPQSDGVFVHMCPEYVRIVQPVNIFFRKPVAMWYAHVEVSGGAAWAVVHVDYVLSPSTESFKLPTGKLVATGHGIDTNHFTPATREPRSKRRIVSLSRISYVKDLDTLIEAARILVHDMKKRDIVFDIFGGPARPEDDAYLQHLKTKVKEYGLVSCVEWRGTVSNSDSVAVYRDADVFVRMQQGGGFGKTELEAMSCGAPVALCTPVYNSHFPEFAADMYFNAGDAQGLADRISTILEWDDQRLTSYRTIAYSFVREHHDLDHLAARIIDTFQHA